MATKGTPQYNVWKAKYEASKLRKSGLQSSLFTAEQVENLVSSTYPNLSKAENFSLDHFTSNTPIGVKFDLWQKASKKATKDGTKNNSYGAVRSIYNAYVKKEQVAKAEEDEEMSKRISNLIFCNERALAELALEESFN